MIFHLQGCASAGTDKRFSDPHDTCVRNPRIRKKIVDDLRRRRFKVWSGLFYPSEPHYKGDRLAAIMWCWNASEGMRRCG
jgi:hypothetical protein